MNPLQQQGLSWILTHEMEDQVELEKLRAVNTGLATNPATAKDFILGILNEHEEQTETDEEWTTPRSVEEIEQFLRQNAL